MTALRATPPRLPVRDRSTAGERVPRGLSPMLSRLAAERATGVLLRERGTLYLAEGRVVHAESPSAPGLDVLLTAHGTLSTTAWQDAVARADERHGAARLLVDSGRIAPGTLELCHLGALYDAAYFALAPSSTPGRFRYGTGHWLGAVRPVPVAAVERETLRRRDLLHRIWPDPGTDSAPLAPADPPRTPALTARQRAVVALLDGVRTATDIARALGRPAFHTLVDIRRLAAAGVLAPRPVEPERGDSPATTEPLGSPAATTPPHLPSIPRPAPPDPTRPGHPQDPEPPPTPKRTKPPGPTRPEPPARHKTPQPEPASTPSRTKPTGPTPGPTRPEPPARHKPPQPEPTSTPSRTKPAGPPPVPTQAEPPPPEPPLGHAPARARYEPQAPAPPPLPTRPGPTVPAERLVADDPDVALLKRVRDALEAL
ncbi:hypothetical protein [Streptomyces sp. P17]|uniref:hypothetical protein n=1 Tax=Streptomyces sp. P17 TaxID=3074716 RepID=UPI0037DC876D